MKTNKVVINVCYGGYGLSVEAAKRLFPMLTEEEKLQFNSDDWEYRAYRLDSILKRHDSRLVSVVERMEDEASGDHAKLCVVVVEGNLYSIDEYNGFENITTPGTETWVVIK